MPILESVSPSTVPFSYEIGTDSVYKMPSVTDKAVVTGVMLGYSDDYESINIFQELNTEMLEDVSDVNVRVPAVSRLSKVGEGVLAAVLQIWEGTVISVNEHDQSMSVKLVDRAGIIVEHNAEIDLEWVAPQDLKLVKPGAVFYWTIYKETKSGTVKNSEEIQFRRLPNWTKKQIEQLYEDADVFLATFAT